MNVQNREGGTYSKWVQERRERVQSGEHWKHTMKEGSKNEKEKTYRLVPEWVGQKLCQNCVLTCSPHSLFLVISTLEYSFLYLPQTCLRLHLDLNIYVFCSHVTTLDMFSPLCDSFISVSLWLFLILSDWLYSLLLHSYPLILIFCWPAYSQGNPE